MTAPDRRDGDNVLVFPEADKLSFFQNSSWSDFGSATKDFSPQMPRRQAAPTSRKPRRRNSMIETYGSHSHSELFGSGSSHEDVFGSDLMAADPWVDFKDEFGMSEHCKDRDDSFNTTEITSDSSEGDFAGDEEEHFTLHFPSAEAARGEGTMPLRDHNLDKAERNRSRLVSRGRQGRRSPRPPANEGQKRRNRSRSKPSFVAARRTRSLSVPKKAPVVVDQQEKSSSSHSRKAPTESLPTAKGKKNRSEEKSRKTKGDKSTKAPKAPSDKSPKTPSDRSRKAPKASKDKSLKGSKDKSQKAPKGDKSPKISKDKSAKSTRVSRSKSPKSRDKSDKSPKAPKPSRSKSPMPSRSKSPKASRDATSKSTRSKSPRASRSKSPMQARDRSSKASRSKSPMAARDRSSKTSRSKSPMAARDRSSKTSRSKSPTAARDRSSRTSRSKSPMAARDKSSRTSRSKSPMAARDRSSRTSRSKSPMAARDRSSRTSRSKSPMAARDRSSKISRDRSLKVNSEDKSLKSYVTDPLSQLSRKPNGVGMEKKKAKTLFASPLPPKSYLSRGTQKRCLAGVSKEMDQRKMNIKESLANLLCDDDGSIHRRLIVDDEESVHSSTERKRSSSVPKGSGSDSSRSEQIEKQQVPTQRHRRYRRHSIIGSSPSDVAKRVPDRMTRPRSAESLMSSSGHSKQ